MMKGFILGFLEGQGLKEDTFIEEEDKVEEDSPLDLIVHFFGGHHNTVSIVIGTGIYKQFLKSLGNCKRQIHSTVISVREILSASFSFHYRTYSQEVGGELSEIFSNVSEEVEVRDYSPHERIIPEGKGIDTFTPLHGYELKAEGVVSGNVKDVHSLYRKLGQFEVVELQDMELVYGRDLV